MNGRTEVTVVVNRMTFKAFVKDGKVYATKMPKNGDYTTHLVSNHIMGDENILKSCIKSSFYTKW